MKKLLIALGVLLPALSCSVMAQEFPLQIDHKFGTTTIPAQPKRVASVDTNGADNLLALGVQPVVIEYWYGDYEQAVWPWAAALLKSEPTILGRGDLNFEQIAAENPDVVISLWNKLSPDEYEQLSKIAPVVSMPEGVGDFELSWDQQAIIAGRAVGREAEAIKQVEAIQQKFSDIAKAHPEWQGKTIAVASANDEGVVGAFTSADARPQILAQLGFVTNPVIDQNVGANAYYLQFSLEALEPLDADLLIWLDSDSDFTAIENLEGRAFLNAHKEGREILLGKEVTGAFSHGSLLSLPYALDALVPAIEAALDGDPESHADNRTDGTTK